MSQGMNVYPAAGRRSMRHWGAALLATVALAAAAVAQPTTQLYRGGITDDLAAPNGSTITFNTDTFAFTGAGGATPATGFFARDEGGVAVFGFRNVTIGDGVTINVTGQRPISIAAEFDMSIGAFNTINVSGSNAFPGRSGGGIGGNGGPGADGGGGGNGGTSSGGGGGGGTGGAGGGSVFANGQDGFKGNSGNDGGQGNVGSIGLTASIDGSGGTVGYPYTSSGAGFGGPRGTGGAFNNNAGNGGGGGVNGATGCSNGSQPFGRGGCNGGDDLFGGNNGQPGEVGTGGGGAAGGTGGGAGASGTDGGTAFLAVSPSTLQLYGGHGGGGGGGGQGGQGGGGGGKGGGAQGGGGGGGGGSGCVADGGRGGDGGGGGGGGNGGRGGDGGSGGPGGKGGNGGGAIVLSARGLLQVNGLLTVDISAGPRSAGTGGTANPGNRTLGSNGAGGAPGQGGSGGSGSFCGDGGDGGNGGNGATGGRGGDGGFGGDGGNGGGGGFGTPGMLKLHGSVIMANQIDVIASNGGGVDAIYNGKLTMISNMTSQALNVNVPTGGPVAPGRPADLIPATIDVGIIFNADTRGTSLYDTVTTHPLIPQLTTGPATSGILLPGYFNQTLVESETPQATLPDAEPVASIKTIVLSGVNESVFDGFDQVFFRNNSGSDFSNLYVIVNSGTPVLLNGTGNLNDGQTFSMTVLAGLGTTVQLLQAPIITAQPNNVGAFPGSNVSFTVTAVSASPACNLALTPGDFCYQWQTNRTGIWQDIVGPGTNGREATLNLTNIQEADQGNYRVRVINNAGQAQSIEAFLDVFDPPTITTQPAWTPASPCAYPSAPFVQATVAVSLTSFGVSYQWQKFNTTNSLWEDIPGAAAQLATYTILSPQPSDEGTYRCRVSNPAAPAGVLSNTAFLDMCDGIAITTNPSSVSAPPGFVVTFGITVIGQVPHFVGWDFSTAGPTGPWTEVQNPNTNINVYTFQRTASAATRGWYRAKVYNLAAPGVFVYSAPAQLEVNDPGILQQPQSIEVLPGQPAQFTVLAQGTGTLTYQWFKNGTLMPGRTATLLVFASAQETDEAEYRCQVTGTAGNIMSEGATLTVTDPPTILQQPLDAQRDPGESAILQVAATASQPITYQWYFQGLPIADGVSPWGSVRSGTATPTLQITNLQFDDEDVPGSGYYCRVSITPSLFTNSDTAEIFVGDQLECVGQTGCERAYANQFLLRFTSETLGGRGTRVYQWYKDNVAIGAPQIPVGSVSTFELTLIDFDDAGTYRCDVTDDRGTITCAMIDLSVYSRLTSVVVPGPAEIELFRGEALELLSNIEGGALPLTYAWNREDLSKGAKVLVGTAPTLTIDPVQVEDSGIYTLTVTDAGNCDEAPEVIESNEVRVTIEIGVPAAGGLGLAFLAGATALAGVFGLRRKRN